MVKFWCVNTPLTWPDLTRPDDYNEQRQPQLRIRLQPRCWLDWTDVQQLKAEVSPTAVVSHPRGLVSFRRGSFDSVHLRKLGSHLPMLLVVVVVAAAPTSCLGIAVATAPPGPRLHAFANTRQRKGQGAFASPFFFNQCYVRRRPPC